MKINAKLKSLFVLPAAGISFALVLWSIVEALIARSESLAWWGAAIAGLGFPLFFAQVFFGKKARTSENLPFIVLVSSSGLLIAGWQVFIVQAAYWPPFAVAATGSGLFLIYIAWYSRFGRFESARISVGSKLPEFSLSDTDGNEFSSADLAGAPAVVLFYRGNWCPFCTAQVREIADQYSDMEKLGINVVMISPQPDGYTRELAAKFDAPIRFLVDKDNRLAEELDIAVSNGVPLGVPGDYEPDTVLPTVIVANSSGTIVFCDQTDNYRVRPEPDMFLAILRRAEAMAR